METSIGIEKLGLDIPESCEYIGGITRQTLYRVLADNPEIRTYKIGSRRFIYRDDLKRYVYLLGDREVASDE